MIAKIDFLSIYLFFELHFLGPIPLSHRFSNQKPKPHFPAIMFVRRGQDLSATLRTQLHHIPYYEIHCPCLRRRWKTIAFGHGGCNYHVSFSFRIHHPGLYVHTMLASSISRVSHRLSIDSRIPHLALPFLRTFHDRELSESYTMTWAMVWPDISL